MRPPKLTTTLAVLRNTIELGQKEFADQFDRPVAYVQSIELGRRPLKPDFARQIATRTGVSLRWLTKGDAKLQIVTPNGKPYTQEMYAQKTKLKQFKPEDLDELPKVLTRCFANMCRAALAAHNHGTLPQFRHRLEHFASLLKGFPGYEKRFQDTLDQIERVSGQSSHLKFRPVIDLIWHSYMSAMARSLESVRGNSLRPHEAKRKEEQKSG